MSCFVALLQDIACCNVLMEMAWVKVRHIGTYRRLSMQMRKQEELS